MSKPPLNPTAMTPEDVVKLLSRMGCGKVTLEMVKSDIEDGAPTNADGTIHIVRYCGWLVSELGRNPTGDAHGP